MALAPIGVGVAYVGWHQGFELYGASEFPTRTLIGPATTILTSAGLVIGGWASDRFGRWKTWLWAGTLLAATAIVLALFPPAPSYFLAGILLYTLIAACCTAAFWAIVVAAASPRLSITKITLITILTNVAVFYMRDFDGWAADDFSFRYMLVFEALLSLLCIGIMLLIRPFRRQLLKPE